MKKEQIIGLHDKGFNAEYISQKVGSTIQCVRAVISQHKRLQKAQKQTITQPAEKPQEAPKKTVSIDLSELIPEENKDYIPRKLGCGFTDMELISKMYETRYKNKNPRFPLLIGDTGSGKTVLLSTFAGKKKIPYMRLNLNGATTPEDLVGQFIQNSEGKFIWVDGWLTMFMRHGGLLVLDEINMCNADILSILHSVTDTEKRLVLAQKDGEVIHAHNEFWVAATMNPDYEGTKPLNTALRDRFIEISIPYCVKVERKLGIDKKFMEVVEKLRQSEAIIRPVSTRDLINYKDDIVDFGTETANFFFINRFDTAEQKVVAEILDLTMNGDEPQPEVEQND